MGRLAVARRLLLRRDPDRQGELRDGDPGDRRDLAGADRDRVPARAPRARRRLGA